VRSAKSVRLLAETERAARKSDGATRGRKPAPVCAQGDVAQEQEDFVGEEGDLFCPEGDLFRARGDSAQSRGISFRARGIARKPAEFAARASALQRGARRDVGARGGRRAG
jgi:hypothetical protein